MKYSRIPNTDLDLTSATPCRTAALPRRKSAVQVSRQSRISINEVRFERVLSKRLPQVFVEGFCHSTRAVLQDGVNRKGKCRKTSGLGDLIRSLRRLLAKDLLSKLEALVQWEKHFEDDCGTLAGRTRSGSSGVPMRKAGIAQIMNHLQVLPTISK